MHITPKGLLLRWINDDPAYQHLAGGFDVDPDKVNGFENEIAVLHPKETEEWQHDRAVLYAASHPGFKGRIAAVREAAQEPQDGPGPYIAPPVPPAPIVNVEFPQTFELGNRTMFWLAVLAFLMMCAVLIPKVHGQPSSGGPGPGSQLTFKGLNSAGTVLFTRQTGLVQIKCGGNFLSCTWTAATNTFFINPGAGNPGTVTSVGFTGGLISVANPTTTPAFTVAGTSGGIPYFSAAATWASSGALTANLPVIGGGAGVSPTVGSRSGNTTVFGTTSGSLTSGNCLQSDASGNIVDAGAACGGAGASPGGSDKNVQYNNSGSFGGVTNNATATKKYLQQVSTGTPSFVQVAAADLSDGTTGSGAVVLATSPTLVTPALGTPSALVLTNATSLPCGAMPALTGGVTSSAGSCATTAATLSVASLARTLVWQFYDGGPALTTSSSALTYITAESTCTINSWSISADAGTATAKVWKVAAGTAIPTISNVINTSGVALSSGTHIRSTTVSDFTTTTITQGDILTVVLTAAATATKLTFQLGCATVQ